MNVGKWAAKEKWWYPISELARAGSDITEQEINVHLQAGEASGVWLSSNDFVVNVESRMVQRMQQVIKKWCYNSNRSIHLIESPYTPLVCVCTSHWEFNFEVWNSAATFMVAFMLWWYLHLSFLKFHCTGDEYKVDKKKPTCKGYSCASTLICIIWQMFYSSHPVYWAPCSIFRSFKAPEFWTLSAYYLQAAVE